LAKIGAFVGTLTFPLVNGSLGLAGVMTIAAGTAGVGLLLTRLLPEPSGKSLEELTGQASDEAEETAREPQSQHLTTAAT
jgi:hypothetical protein